MQVEAASDAPALARAQFRQGVGQVALDDVSAIARPAHDHGPGQQGQGVQNGKGQAGQQRQESIHAGPDSAKQWKGAPRASLAGRGSDQFYWISRALSEQARLRWLTAAERTVYNCYPI